MEAKGCASYAEQLAEYRQHHLQSHPHEVETSDGSKVLNLFVASIIKKGPAPEEVVRLTEVVLGFGYLEFVEKLYLLESELHATVLDLLSTSKAVVLKEPEADHERIFSELVALCLTPPAWRNVFIAFFLSRQVRKGSQYECWKNREDAMISILCQELQASSAVLLSL